MNELEKLRAEVAEMKRKKEKAEAERRELKQLKSQKFEMEHPVVARTEHGLANLGRAVYGGFARGMTQVGTKLHQEMDKPRKSAKKGKKGKAMGGFGMGMGGGGFRVPDPMKPIKGLY